MEGYKEAFLLNHQEPDMKMRILLAAKKLFARQGYEGTSVRQICEEAGANIALVSYHFGGKEKVFYELFKQFFPSHLLEVYANELIDPLKGMDILIREVIMLRHRDADLITILQLEMILNSPRIEVLRERAFPVWKKVRELLELGRTQGYYRFDSLDSTLMFVLGAIFFYKQREFFEPLFTDGQPDTETLIQQTKYFVMNGLGYTGAQ
ncbi:HTH-type transcriptional repressor NicS [compost metagenome]